MGDATSGVAPSARQIVAAPPEGKSIVFAKNIEIAYMIK